MKRSHKLSKGWVIVGLGLLAAGIAAPAYVAHVGAAPSTSAHAEVRHGGESRDGRNAGWFIHY